MVGQRACLGWTLAALVLGSLVYILDRPADSSLLQLWADPVARNFDIFGGLGGSLPSFTHAFAFSLLSAWVLETRKAVWLSCAAWATVQLAFELGQHDAVSAYLPRIDYFRGTFDILDASAAFLACLLSALIANSQHRRAS